MKTLVLSVSDRVAEFFDEESAVQILEKEAERLEHIRRSLPLTRAERDLRAAIGKEAYRRLTPTEKTRMLSCIEYQEGS